MAVTTLTSKGQMTLPKDVRDDLKVGPGDKIDIIKRDGVYLLRPRRSAVDLIGKYKRPGQQPLTVEDMDEAIGKAVTERYERSLDRD
ncbi:AbrB/MazE/SpoVT family DNA-binding domain-containing protein [Devosia sp. A449]